MPLITGLLLPNNSALWIFQNIVCKAEKLQRHYDFVNANSMAPGTKKIFLKADRNGRFGDLLTELLHEGEFLLVGKFLHGATFCVGEF